MCPASTTWPATTSVLSDVIGNISAMSVSEGLQGDQSSHRVVAFVHPPQSTFELAIAAEVFGLGRPNLPLRYRFQVCAEHTGPVRTQAGYDIAVTAGLSAMEMADTIVVPGWQSLDVPAPAGVIDALRSAHGRGARILGLCAGAFVLAQAGLLDGRTATTHWRLAADLADRYPDVQVDPDVLYIDHGDVASSAGTAAGIDLCLHIVRADHGAAYAAEVARHMVMPPRREGGQLQFTRPPSPRRGQGSLAPVLDWAAGRLREPITVQDLAAQARLSPRTFARHFHQQVGVSPGRWVLTQRISAARTLLEETDLPVESVATKVGLSSAINLRRHFHRHLRTTPAAYRRAFRQLP
jgi:AraC family transcriptional regulator, transcriptional activator FtrA